MRITVVHDGITYHCSFSSDGLIGIQYVKNSASGLPFLNTTDISIFAIKQSLPVWVNERLPVSVKEQVERVIKLWAFR